MIKTTAGSTSSSGKHLAYPCRVVASGVGDLTAAIDGDSGSDMQEDLDMVAAARLRNIGLIPSITENFVGDQRGKYIDFPYQGHGCSVQIKSAFIKMSKLMSPM